jgi:prephenate dehydratase
MKVGKRLQKSAEVLAHRLTGNPCRKAIVGLDGGYVRSRHPRPERNFEVLAGKVLDESENVTRFASVRDGGSQAVGAAGLALRQRGLNESTSVTVLTDGDAGLRAIHHQLAPQAERVLD